MYKKTLILVLAFTMAFFFGANTLNLYTAQAQAVTPSLETALTEMELTDEEKTNVYMSLCAIAVGIVLVAVVGIICAVGSKHYIKEKKPSSYTFIAKPGPDAYKLHYDNEDDKNKYDYV